jgi:hypothetical protein
MDRPEADPACTSARCAEWLKVCQAGGRPTHDKQTAHTDDPVQKGCCSLIGAIVVIGLRRYLSDTLRHIVHVGFPQESQDRAYGYSCIRMLHCSCSAPVLVAYVSLR